MEKQYDCSFEKARRIRLKKSAKEILKNNKKSADIILCTYIMSLFFILRYTHTDIIKFLTKKVWNGFLVLDNTWINILFLVIYSLLLIGYRWYTLDLKRGNNAEICKSVFGINILKIKCFISETLADFVSIIGTIIVEIILMFLYEFAFLLIGDNAAIAIRSSYYTDNVAAIMIGVAYGLLTSLIFFFFKCGFSQIYYLYKDDEEYAGVLTSLFESWELTKGRKLELVMLVLSFWGWYILTVATLGLAGIYAFPYIHITLAEFYDELKREKSVSL